MPGRTPRSKPLVACALVVCVIVGLVSGSFPAAAQAPKSMFRVGFLAPSGRTPDGGPPRPLREALRELGYLEGRNIAYEARFAERKVERLPGLAADLVGLKVDVIVAVGGTGIEAARRATSTIPIVMAAASGDAVAVGWIASTRAPGRQHHRNN